MTYAMLEEKIRSLPEECLSELMDYADYILFRYEKRQQENQSKKGNLEEFFASVHYDEDGLEIQRKMRNEWD